MRYLNWDVLLFPDRSRIPMQEFDLKCQVVRSVQSIGSVERSDYTNKDKLQPGLGQLPTLTAFISSLEQAQPFRVSLHSWEKPVPSELLLKFNNRDDAIAYEIRIYIDGVLKARRQVGDHTAWPEVIESPDASHPSDDMSDLRFPPFHPQILEQRYWKPDDGLGRIRIVIAEGIINKFNRLHPSIGTFDRLRDVVAFSFQHAPHSVLQHAGIAWPNPHLFKEDSTTDLHVKHRELDVHTLSPRLTLQRPIDVHTPTVANKSCTTASEVGRAEQQATELTISARNDPFLLNSTRVQLESRRRANANGPISDLRSVTRSSEASGPSAQAFDLEQHIDGATIDNIIRDLTPSTKKSLLEALTSTTRAAHLEPRSSYITLDRNSKPNSPQSFRSSMRVRVAATHRNANLGQMSSTSSPFMQTWQDDPTSGEMWSHRELLRLSACDGGRKLNRTGLAVSKRKRSMSPLPMESDRRYSPLTDIEGMSTSPCKKSPTANETMTVNTSRDKLSQQRSSQSR